MRQTTSLPGSLLAVVLLLLTSASQTTTPTLASDATHQNNLADVGGGDQSQTNGNEKFVVRRVGDNRFIDVYYGNHHLFTVQDRKDSGTDEADNPAPGSPSYQPATLIDDYDHDFYLAPDHKHLFIEQKMMHCYDVATLYGPHPSGRYGMILVHGRPFDEAAGRAYCKIMHIDFKHGYDGETRVTHFVRWTNGGLDFATGAGNFYCGDGPLNEGEIEYDWSGHFDFKTQRFTRIHLDKTYTHQMWKKEMNSR